jgi:hypothetical protein
VLYILVYVPTMIVPIYSLTVDRELWYFLASIAVSFLLLGTVYALPLIRLPRFRLSPQLYWGLVAALSIACYVIIFLRFGFKIRVVSLASVYDLRGAYRDELATNGRGVAYAMAWQGNVLNPMIVAYGLTHRRPLFVIIGFFGQMALFSITGLKGVLFSTMMLALIFVAFGSIGRWFGINSIWGSTFLVMVSVMTDFLRDSTIMVSLFVRRLIITPGLLSGFYFDFFSTNEMARYAYSFLSPFFEYPYDATPPFIIGLNYFHNAETSANANIWADAFSSFGIAGVLTISLILASIFWLLDCLMADTDIRMAVLMLGLPAIALSNSSLFVTFVTHGLGLVLLLAFLMPKIRVEDHGNPSRVVSHSKFK